MFRDWCRCFRTTRSAQWHVVAAQGDTVDLDGYVVRPLARATHGDSMTGPGLLYDVTAPPLLLNVTDTGPLLERRWPPPPGGAYDVVLLEDTFGDQLVHGGRPPRPRDLPRRTPPRCGRRGCPVDATDVVAVHLGHRNPSDP